MPSTLAAAGPPRRNVFQATGLIRELIGRDIKLRYRGSLLGVLWTLLNPLTELLVLMFVFGLVLRLGIPNFPAYLFTGLLAFGWFQTSLNFATASVAGNRELVRRPGVPVSVLPVITVASNLVHFMLALPILFGLLLFTDVSIGWTVVLLPIVMAVEFVLILGLAYPLAAIHVWFRDTQHVLRIALQLLFYMTPIFYETRHLPERVRFFYGLNPMVQIVDAYRAVLLRGEMPDPQGFSYLMVVSVLLLTAGYTWFRRTSYRFPDEL
jgi:lipopolysaccharide transport system permease protein